MRRREGAAAGAAGLPKVSNKGTLPEFVFCGYVQAVHASNNTKYPCDYVRFAIKPNGLHNDPEEFATIFAVTVPHSCGFELEIGDAVIIRGHVNSWKKEDNIYGRWYRLELVADVVQEWDGRFKSERNAPAPQQAMPPGAADMLERRGSKIYPAGTAPAPAEDFHEATPEELAEFEAGIIGASAPPPF